MSKVEKLLVKYTSRETVNPRIKMLLAGESGSGKTKFIKQFPKPFIIAARPGFEVLADENIPYTEFRSVNDFNTVVKAIRHGNLEVETVVIDCLDEIHRRLMLLRQIEQGRNYDRPDDYTWVGQIIHQGLMLLTSLDVNVVCITHVQEDKTDDLDVPAFKPNISGRLGTAILNYFDYRVFLKTNYLLNEDDESKGFYHSTLQSVPTESYPWCYSTLEPFMKLDFSTDYDKIMSSREEFLETLAKDKKEIMIQIGVVVDDDDKDLDVPGMSSAEEINNKLKLNNNENE